MSTTTPNLNLIQPSKSEKGGWTTYITNNATIDNAYGAYLNDREQSLENIAPIEGATASKNYTVGSYLVKDGGLYKVTAAIASGESIVVGTNVVATSLNDAVVELNTAVATLQDAVGKVTNIKSWPYERYADLNINVQTHVTNHENILFGIASSIAEHRPVARDGLVMTLLWDNGAYGTQMFFGVDATEAYIRRYTSSGWETTWKQLHN